MRLKKHETTGEEDSVPGAARSDHPYEARHRYWGGDLGKRAISAAHQHSLPRHARRRQHWGRYKRYQLDAKRHRADTKGMYRDRTGCLHTSTQVLPLGGYDDPKVLPTQRHQDLSLISNNRS